MCIFYIKNYDEDKTFSVVLTCFLNYSQKTYLIYFVFTKCSILYNFLNESLHRLRGFYRVKGNSRLEISVQSIRIPYKIIGILSEILMIYSSICGYRY